MRIDTKEIPGLRDLTLDPPDAVKFESALPSEDLLSIAWGNPDFEALVDSSNIGQNLTTNAARANRWVQGIGGAKLGIPSSVIPAFERAVHKWGPTLWREYADDITESAMDLGLKAMGSVPIIGWAAEIAATLIVILVENSKKKKQAPPNVRYDKEADEKSASFALQDFYAGDMRNVFLPPRSDVTGWGVEPRDTGFAVVPHGNEWGRGVIPGASVVAGQLYSEVHWSHDNWLSCSAGSCGAAEGSISKRDRANVRRDWEAVFDGTIKSNGENLPSLRRVGAALWTSLSSTKTAGAFDLDTTGIPEAWAEWSDAAAKSARDSMNGGVKKMYLDRYVGFQALQRSTDLSFFGIEGQRTVAGEAWHRIQEVRRLQESLLDTLVVAYASEHQAAFNDPKLRSKLRARRVQLLSHMARWKVSPEDIPDAAYRTEFESATAGDRPFALAPPSGEFDGTPKRVNPIGRPSASASPGGLILLAGAAAALLLG